MRHAQPLLAFALLLLSACGGDGSAEDAAERPPLDREEPARVLADLETDLVESRGVEISFEVHATGAFTADLAGHLALTEEDRLHLEATGAFGTEEIRVGLRATADSLTWWRSEETFDAARPSALRDGVVIGLVRMGVLHNLARLAGGVPPDATGGEVREWVRALEIRWSDETPPVGAYGLAFEIEVQGEPAGEATLWFDEAGVLLGRDQFVRFPGGDMEVRERYRHAPR